MSGVDLVTFINARLDEREAAAKAWPEDVRTWKAVGTCRIVYERDGEEPFASEARGQAEMLEKVLRLLATPFASHPDFDPAWTVEGTVTT